MATPLNLYATKVFAEHPLALWPLDESVDYISLLNNSEQNFSNWTSSGSDSVVDATDESVFTLAPPIAPFKDSYTSGVISSLDNSGNVSFLSPRSYQPSDFSNSIKTVSINVFMYSYSKVVDVRLGYEYVNPDNLQTYEVIKAAAASTTLEWAAIQESFELPDNFQDLRFVVEFYYEYDGRNYEFAINGISVGQWAEDTQLKSLGVRSFDDLSAENIATINNTKSIKAEQYGFPGNSGYYLTEDNYLISRNNGLPLVFGAKNSTKIIPSSTSAPSLILPGFGFMNSSGINSKLTLEFWAKIQSSSLTAKRIVGPISSSDGLYVDGPFLKLVVGGRFISHPVRDWDRPMLIDIRVSSETADLLVNGKEVGSINRRLSVYKFPDSLSSSDEEQDWIGFYAHNDVSPIQIDCVGVYPYMVSEELAKRRWAYGQAVKFPSDIKGTDTTDDVVADFAFSNYSKNYSFPSTSSWSNGIVENLAVEDDAIQMQEHPLPLLRMSDKKESEWLNVLSLANASDSDTFISLRPDLHATFSQDTAIDWTNTEGYLYYPNMNFLSETTKAFYGIFQTRYNYEEKQTLFKITNKVNSNYVEIYLNREDYNGTLENTITYSFNFKNADGSMTEDIFYKSRGQHTGDRFLVGLDIDRFVQDSGDKVANFFGTRQQLTIYIGGKPDFTDTYKGLIRRVAFCNKRNLQPIKHFFTDYGVPVDYENVFNLFGISTYDAGADYFGNDESYWSLVLDGGSPYDFVTIGTEEHTATYTLMGRRTFDTFYLDIDCNSYWEDYIPLSYFAKSFTDGRGNTRRSFSFLQFNMAYPELKNIVNDEYSLSGSVVRAYVSFSYLDSGASKITSSFSSTQPLNINKVVAPDSSWLTTKYEVVDGSIIYPPSNININRLAINIHLEINAEGISTNPISLRSVQLSSQLLSNSPTQIGTKLGKSVVPYKRAGSYYSYNNVEPFEVYRGTSPYLYLSGNSGMQIRSNYSNSLKSGLSIALNSRAAPFFKIGSMQMFLRYGKDLMPTVPVKIFELQGTFENLEFFLVSDSTDRTRGQIYALNKEKRISTSLVFFNNGVPSKRGILYPNSWSALGISFPDFFDLSRNVGALRFTSPIRFDNVSFYQTTLADDEERFGFRQWFSVRSNLGSDIDWGYWAGKEIVGDEVVPIPGAGFSWQEVLFLSSLLREEIDGSNLYNVFTGTERIIAENSKNLQIQDYQYNFFQNIFWSENVVSAV